jgi:hypothetical protein
MKENSRSKGGLILLCLGLLFVGLVVIWSGAGKAKAASSSEQVVFSGTGTFDEGSSLAGSPFGFWIWCEAESDNEYVGECKGSMYIYALGLVKHVEDAEEPGIVELSEGIYQMNVASTKDHSIAATLQNTDEPVKGPRNTVTVTFTTPDVGTGTSHTAVVTVTGPGD